MSPTAATGAPPRITDAALDHLGGRPLVLRTSPRHGCCGGSASVPVAEVGPPVGTGDYRVLRAGPVDVYVAVGLEAVDSWTVDVDGLWRWTRLRVDGAEMEP